jgi:hypothetical protein
MIQRIRECCDILLDRRCTQPIQDHLTKCQPLLPLSQPSITSSRHNLTLPPREIALEYLSLAFEQTQPLFRFIHMPSFYVRFEQFYNARDSHSISPTLDDVRFEALLNELFALGELLLGGAKA